MIYEELHQVQIYFYGHGYMMGGRVCMIIPHAKEEEYTWWDDRINIFELEGMIQAHLGGKNNLKVLNYFDCNRTSYNGEDGRGGGGPSSKFAGNIYSLFSCNENS